MTTKMKLPTVKRVVEKLEVFGEPSMLTTINVSKLSETELKTWIALLYNARNSLTEQKTHSCSLNALMEQSGYSRKSLKRFKEVLRSLVGKTVEVNLVGKEKTIECGIASALVGSVNFVKNRGHVLYDFPEGLRDIVSNSTMFSNLSLSVMRNIQTKSALSLYRLCNDYRKVFQTPTIPLEILRKTLGVEDAYPDFRLFNDKILKPAVQRVGQSTDLVIRAENIRYDGHKVSHIKFHITEGTLPFHLSTEAISKNRKPAAVKTKKPKSILRHLTREQIETQLELLNTQNSFTPNDIRVMNELNQALGQ